MSSYKSSFILLFSTMILNASFAQRRGEANGDRSTGSDRHQPVDRVAQSDGGIISRNNGSPRTVGVVHPATSVERDVVRTGRPAPVINRNPVDVEGNNGNRNFGTRPPRINPIPGGNPSPRVNPTPSPVVNPTPSPRVSPSPSPVVPRGNGNSVPVVTPRPNITPAPITPRTGYTPRPVITPGPATITPVRDVIYRHEYRHDFRGYADRRWVFLPNHYYHYYHYRPRTFVTIVFGGYPYYYDDGIYYSQYEGYYRPLYPPCGLHIRILPARHRVVYVGLDMFYYYDGIFYRRYHETEYEIVQPPLGAVVTSLPKGAKAVIVNGEKFYEVNGTFYREGTNDKSEVIYTVVGKNGEINNTDAPVSAGPTPYKVNDYIGQLPQGCKTVTISGEKLYLSPDGYYFKEEADADSKVTYKVVGTP
jgi:hypothetical protein